MSLGFTKWEGLYYTNNYISKINAGTPIYTNVTSAGNINFTITNVPLMNWYILAAANEYVLNMNLETLVNTVFKE